MLKVWMLFMLHNCWLGNWSQWGLWGALISEEHVTSPEYVWFPKTLWEVKSLRFCKPWKRCSRSCWHYHLMDSKETVFLSNAESRRNCLSVRLLNSKYLSKCIYLIDLFNTAPSPFSGNTWWTYYHLSHDISPSYLHSKAISVNVFWGAAICCYHATRTFFAPVCSLWSSLWHSLQQLALFPLPSASHSPSGNVPDPLANRIRNLSLLLYFILLEEQTTGWPFESQI